MKTNYMTMKKYYIIRNTDCYRFNGSQDSAKIKLNPITGLWEQFGKGISLKMNPRWAVLNPKTGNVTPGYGVEVVEITREERIEKALSWRKANAERHARDVHKNSYLSWTGRLIIDSEQILVKKDKIICPKSEWPKAQPFDYGDLFGKSPAYIIKYMFGAFHTVCGTKWCKENLGFVPVRAYSGIPHIDAYFIANPEM